MQRNNGSQEAAEVHDKQRVVCAARKAHREGWVSQVRQQVERVLEEVDDLVVYGHHPARDVGEVALDVGQTGGQTAQGRQLFRDARPEGGRRRVLDVAQEVLDADLFCLFRLDGRWRMEERFACFRAIL